MFHSTTHNRTNSSLPVLQDSTHPSFDGDLEQFQSWLSNLKTTGMRRAGLTLLLTLDQLVQAELSTSRRLKLLAILKIPILKLCAGLPKPVSNQSDQFDQASATNMTLEQRIYRSMFKNLQRLLRQIDQRHFLLSLQQRERRDWTVHNLYRFAYRQIRYAALWNCQLPENTWRDVHELTAYIHARPPSLADAAGLPRLSTATLPGQNLHDLAYKKLLLYGLAARTKHSLIKEEKFVAALDQWASETQLMDPRQVLGKLRPYLVEISADHPPYQHVGPLDLAFRGWAIQVPNSFATFLLPK